MIDKRRFPRLDITVKTEYTVLDKPVKIPQVRTKDISIAGLCIKTQGLLIKGSFIDIKFYLPKDKNPIEAIGRVVWLRQYKTKDKSKIYVAGIEFVKINYADQERIGKFMAKSKNRLIYAS